MKLFRLLYHGYFNREEFKSAKEVIEQAIQTARENNNLEDLFWAQRRLTVVHGSLYQHDKQIQSETTALEIARELKNDLFISMSLP